MAMTIQDILLTRTLAAPVEVVWRAWTDPDVLTRWWGPIGFTSHSATIDLRPGGRFIWNMRAPEELGGFDMYTAGTYTRIVEQEAIDFVQWLSDADGEPIDPVAMGMPADFPHEIRASLAFEQVTEGTRLTAAEYDWPLGEQRSLSEAGLAQCIDKLEAILPELAAR
jgi:uncharacterized protein YndB with AHSA1/START domain